jgi:transmembrane sensor
MNKSYLKLSVGELVDDLEFISWVLRGKNQKSWELFLTEYPEYKPTVHNARRIVELVRDHHEHLTDEDNLKIWKSIEEFNESIRNRQPKFEFRSLIRYAAVLLIALSIGSAGYWIFHESQKSYVYKSSPAAVAGNRSSLFLSNGTRIDLEKKDSKIALNSEKKIIIDNEKEIDLSQSSNPDESKMNEVVIPFGKKSHLKLEDGTRVWLNAGSRMAFPTKFTGNEREVFLEGEAYFEVAHNPELPFVVHAGEIVVKALGTRFNLSAYKTDNLFETVLIEGKVAINKQSIIGFLKNETILLPNQKASFNQSDHSISVHNDTDVEFAIAWTEGWFKFSQQSVYEVLNKLQRYYNVRFVLERQFSSTDLISGKLDLKESIEQVMAALGDVTDLQYRINGNNIYIEKKLMKEAN